MVEVHCVRDNGNNTHQWLVGSDWLRVRVRDSSIRLEHRGYQPFSRKSGKLPFFSIPFLVFTSSCSLPSLPSVVVSTQIDCVCVFLVFRPIHCLHPSCSFFSPSSCSRNSDRLCFFVFSPMYHLRPSCSLPSLPPSRKLRLFFVCALVFAFRPI